MEKNAEAAHQMPIKNFKEKDIRSKILKKIEPEIRKGRSKHSKGYIRSEGKIVAKVKIPNDHCRVMKASKSQYIATALRLSSEEFDALTDCSLKGPNIMSC